MCFTSFLFAGRKYSPLNVQLLGMRKNCLVLPKISLLDVKQWVFMGNNDFNDSQLQNEDQNQNQGGKMFTQDEVNEIVRKRLERERKKTGSDDQTDSGTDRARTLEERELKVMAREKLFEAGLPASLADVLRYNDEKSLEKAMEEIKNLNQGAPKAWGQRQSRGGGTKSDPYRKAMGLDR